MPNKVTTLVNTYIDNQGDIIAMRAVIGRAPSSIDADKGLENYISETIDEVGNASMMTDLVTGALSWVDWTGIVNEFTGEGRTTENPTETGDEARTEYNGWKNRATWVIGLWLDNDEPTYNESRRIVKSKVPTKAAAALKSFVRELCSDYMITDTPEHQLRADLINYELGMVDWESIAKGMLEE